MLYSHSGNRRITSIKAVGVNDLRADAIVANKHEEVAEIFEGIRMLMQYPQRIQNSCEEYLADAIVT